jgi:predicted nucleic acid-binding protein
LVDGYALLTSLVHPSPVPRIAPDPDDDVVIGTALAAKADLIVSGDLPLLSVSEYLGVRLVGVAQAGLLIEGGLGR